MREIEDIPFPSLNLFSNIIRRIPRNTLEKFLKGKGLRSSEIDLVRRNSQYAISKLDPNDIIQLIDNYIGSRPKFSIYLFQLDSPLFSNLGEIIDLLRDRNLLGVVGKPRKVYVKTLPTLNFIYLNQSYKVVQLFFYIKGKRKEVLDDEGKIVSQYKLIRSIVTFRENSPLVDVRLNAEFTAARKSLERALELLGLYKKAQKLYFNNLNFVRNILEYVDKVGYLSLEFSGPRLPSAYGKIVYSSRKAHGRPTDLRKDTEVKEKIVAAFRSGSIARMHGEVKFQTPIFIDEYVSFGINFRENRLYVFSTSCEGSYRFLFDMLYHIWKGSGVDFGKRKFKTIYDFFSN